MKNGWKFLGVALFAGMSFFAGFPLQETINPPCIEEIPTNVGTNEEIDCSNIIKPPLGNFDLGSNNLSGASIVEIRKI